MVKKVKSQYNNLLECEYLTGDQEVKSKKRTNKGVIRSRGRL
jgi:hypothetical protein